MLNSKQLIELTGISRATLNNYVALGILPAPEVMAPQDGEGRTTRLGYFPDDAVERIQKVQQLKKNGLSIAAIARQIGRDTSTTRQRPAAPAVDEKASQGRDPLARLSIELTVDNFPGPAYMVNNNFELIWWNESAVRNIFHGLEQMPGELESRNLLKLLLPTGDKDVPLPEQLIPHLSAAKRRLSHQSLIKLYSSLQAGQIGLVERLYDKSAPLGHDPIVHFPVTLELDGEEALPCDLYICFYREGILFSYSPVSQDDNYVLDFLSQRNQVIRELLRRRKPYLSHVAVMVADLQNSVRICAELPPEEYFELINDIWQQSEPVFRKYYGTYGKHAGDGMVYYFFPQPDCNYVLNAMQCAMDLQELMRKLTAQWQARKGWLNEIKLNIGLNEGQEWFGTFHAGAHVEFAVLGETINFAARISDFARNGTVWVTKSMLSQLAPEQRRQVNFGIPQRMTNGETLFVKDVYSNVGNLLDPENPKNPKFRDIEMVSVAQIRTIATVESAR